ncbi:MAG: glycosyltransferase family 2 protein [Massiliimalia sp.]|jgi:GT2 family glycosyltransferase
MGLRQKDEEKTVRFWETLAVQLNNLFHPVTVLCAGKDADVLHGAWEALGVTVFSSMDGTLPEKAPETFDLAVVIEGSEAVQWVLGKSDRILVSEDPENTCQVNLDFVRSILDAGMVRDFSGELEDGLSLFVKKDISQQQMAKGYEAFCSFQREEYLEMIADKDRQIQALEDQRRDYELTTQFQMDKLNRTISRLQHDVLSLTLHRDHLQNLYDCVVFSKWWRLTKPGRIFFTKVKQLIKKIPFMDRVIALLRTVKKIGISGVMDKIKYKRRLRRYIPKNSVVISQFVPAKIAVQQIETKFQRDVKFSILVPLYNTPDQFLHEMIDSVINQTYRNWELCLADASDEEHGKVGEICQEYAKKDSRIRYQKLKENGGISRNTNAAIEMATGDYISLLDHDDILHPSALYENMLAITQQGADFMYTDELTFVSNIYDVTIIHLKPDFAIDNLRSNNYICHFSTFSRKLLDEAGWFNPECDGSQDYDIILRLTEKAQKIVHIPKIMYYWRSSANSVASDISAKPYCITAAKKALSEHLNRVGLKGKVSLIDKMPSFYRIKYELDSTPLVSIVIPTKDHIDDLDKCLRSILERTTYPNYEIIVVENNSVKPATFHYYDSIQKEYEQVKVVQWEKGFNYSAINNFGLQFAKGDYFLFLNNDVEILTPDWIQEMMMYAQRPDVGAVGAKLYYPDNTVQHAGIGVGLLTLAGHLHRNFDRQSPGYMGRLIYAQNVSAVTAACVLMRRSVYEEVGGFDEALKVAFNDVDLCLKIRKAGYLIVFTPYAELYHYESKSRGDDMSPEHYQRFASEVKLFQERWKDILKNGDPYLNPNFDYSREDFNIQPKPYR